VSAGLLKMGFASWLTAALAITGCSTNKQHPADMRVLVKAKQPSQLQETPEDDGLDQHGDIYRTPSAMRKHLPLAGTKWEWEGNMSVEGLEVLGNPALFSLEFKPNGWFDFQADCRHGGGIYEASGQRIAFAIIKASRAKCRPDSPADSFINALESAKTFRQADSKLYVELKREAKTMVFSVKSESPN
jgi:heat shock protein HslJ